ncbi:MAG: colanic acid biosynthesis glycosyl transferase, partial [Alphaproteobacteria bacterium]
HHQAMMYKTEFLQEFRYKTRYKIAGDYDLTLRYLQKHFDVHYWPHAICIFESGGLSQKNSDLGRAEQFSIRQDNQVCRPPKNHAIYHAQRANYALRRYLPKLYWFFKSRL